jgi:hypothetical protein
MPLKTHNNPNPPNSSQTNLHIQKSNESSQTKPTYPEITHIMMMRRTTTTEREDTTKTTTIAPKTSTTKGNKLMHKIETHPAIPQLEKNRKINKTLSFLGGKRERKC